MKKLICAAVVAGSMFVMAEEAAKSETSAAPAAAETVKAAPKRAKMSSEQRQKMREMAEKRRAEFMAKKEAQMLEVVRKYVPEEEKAKALVKELQGAMMAGRRNMMRRPKAPAAKPVDAK